MSSRKDGRVGEAPAGDPVRAHGSEPSKLLRRGSPQGRDNMPPTSTTIPAVPLAVHRPTTAATPLSFDSTKGSDDAQELQERTTASRFLAICNERAAAESGPCTLSDPVWDL